MRLWRKVWRFYGQKIGTFRLGGGSAVAEDRINKINQPTPKLRLGRQDKSDLYTLYPIVYIVLIPSKNILFKFPVMQ